MAPFVQLALSWLRFYGMSNPSGTQPTFGQASERRKSIAIVGAGTGGLSALKALLDLPTETRTNWDIVLYEKRSNVGGVWYDTKQVRSKFNFVHLFLWVQGARYAKCDPA